MKSRFGTWQPTVLSAISSGNMEILGEVLESKPSTSEGHSFCAFRELFEAVQFFPGNAEDKLKTFTQEAEALCRAQFDINEVGVATGATPLTWAVQTLVPPGEIQKLMELGADPAKKNREGLSSADLAANGRYISALRLLDVGHKYTELIQDFQISPQSPFLGKWTSTTFDGETTLTLLPDGATLGTRQFSGVVFWREMGSDAEMTFCQEGGSISPLQESKVTSPSYFTTRTAKLSADGKSFVLEKAKAGWEPAMTFTRPTP